jgi:ribosomal protein S27AE
VRFRTYKYAELIQLIYVNVCRLRRYCGRYWGAIKMTSDKPISCRRCGHEVLLLQHNELVCGRCGQLVASRSEQPDTAVKEVEAEGQD